MSARDEQPFGLLEITVAELRPFDRVLTGSELLTVQTLETLTLGAPGDPWYESDPDGGRRIDVIYSGHARSVRRLSDLVLIAVPVQRA